MIDNLGGPFLLNNADAYFVVTGPRRLTPFSEPACRSGRWTRVCRPDHDQLSGRRPLVFGQLVEIRVFPPGDFFKIISRRLGCREWPGEVADFMERDAFWALMIATGGHPRRAFAVLREAMELIAAKNAKQKIRLEHMRAAIDECGEKLAETDIRIFQFLAANGPHSSSDDALMKAVGIARTQLRTRLANPKKALLGVTQETSGSAKKDVYFLRILIWRER